MRSLQVMFALAVVVLAENVDKPVLVAVPESKVDIVVDDTLVVSTVNETQAEIDRWHPKHLLCHPCKKLFDHVRHELHDGVGLTEKKLEESLNHSCKQLTLHLLNHVCHKLSHEAIHGLFRHITEVDKKIDSRKCCKKIGCC